MGGLGQMSTASGVRERRKYLIPEVIQTSGMDCGPATLSALLHGWGIPVSYGRLREACQTDVDGTSIDTLEDLAKQLGLDAAQVMLPVDYFFDSVQQLSAIVLVRTPSGIPHFVVYWRQHGGLVQVMDPVTGRQLRSAAHFSEDLLVHTQVVPAGALLTWLQSDSFQGPLSVRLRQLGLDAHTTARLLDEARADGGWRRWAALDAAARMVVELQQAGAVARGREAARLLLELQGLDDATAAIPETYWAIVAAPPDLAPAAEGELLLLRGAVLIVVYGRLPEQPGELQQRIAQLPSDLRGALSAPPIRPLRALVDLLPRREHALFALAGIGVLATAAMQLALDVLFRGMLHLAWYTQQPLHRLGAFVLAATFVLAICAVGCLVGSQALRLGRSLEVRLRAALFEKLPTLNDHYFSSRPVSDMIERAHSLMRVRQLPQLAMDALRGAGTVVLTTLALTYFLPSERGPALLISAAALLLPLSLQALLAPLDLRARTYAGTLARTYLDALVGLAPLRTHVAERAFTRRHEGLLAGWVAARLRGLRYQVLAQALQLVLGYALVAWLVARYLGHGGDAAGLLLVFYWAVGLPASGADFAQLVSQYPDIRNVTLRLLEPLGAPAAPSATDAPAAPQTTAPLAIQLSKVSVVVAGHAVLHDIDVDIPAGTHVAVVGASGSGKSTLVGLLLGFHKAASGTVRIDGQPVEQADLVRLRAQSAWVDPDVRLWNRSLFDNLHNGHAENRADLLGQAVATTDLGRVIASLPMGLASPLGEGGKLLSGGEGQRVRLGRVLLQPTPRLVLLDEPFRGLDRGQRQDLLDRVRRSYAQSTLLFVSHDIANTLSFPLVWVVADGRIVECGEPAKLQAQPDSQYAALLRAEQSVRHDIWAAARWERVSLVNGQLVAEQRPDRGLEEG